MDKAAARAPRQERIKLHDHSSILRVIVFFLKMINVNCVTQQEVLFNSEDLNILQKRGREFKTRRNCSQIQQWFIHKSSRKSLSPSNQAETVIKTSTWLYLQNASKSRSFLCKLHSLFCSHAMMFPCILSLMSE